MLSTSCPSVLKSATASNMRSNIRQRVDGSERLQCEMAVGVKEDSHFHTDCHTHNYKEIQFRRVVYLYCTVALYSVFGRNGTRHDKSIIVRGNSSTKAASKLPRSPTRLSQNCPYPSLSCSESSSSSHDKILLTITSIHRCMRASLFVSVML